MIKELIKTSDFDLWLRNLKDRMARSRILTRIERLSMGNAGDIKPIRSGVSEMRIDCGPGYRVYFMNHEELVILLLCGGDKSSQKRDIERALRLAEEWRRRKS